MEFKKATRKGAIVRLALIGPAKSGKTYTSLMIATGMKLTGRIAVIDTERGSASMYATEFDFDVLQLDPPYSPERYIEAIHAAETNHQIVLIDSLSHAWAGSGGILEMHDRHTALSSSKNSYMAWGKVTPAHNQLLDAIMGSSIHVIATMRTKTAYDQVQDGGKTRPVKIGLAPVQREGVEFEFDSILTMSPDGHVASCDQDRTHLFDGRTWQPTTETGARISKWLTESAEELQAAQHRSEEALTALMASADLKMENEPTVEKLKLWWNGVCKEDMSDLNEEDKRKLGRYVSKMRKKIGQQENGGS